MKQLADVNLIRPILIFLLVLMHSFTIYGGGWKLPLGIEDVKVYYWLAKFLSGFRMQGIILIAGYVFAFQVLELKRNYTIKGMIKKKFKRLIIPCLFFSIIYSLCFTPLSDIFTISSFISIVSGRGHLWFLTMLFWSFVLMVVVHNYIRVNAWLILIFCALISLVPIPLKFGIGNCVHYFVYFYGGFLLFQHRNYVFCNLLKIRYLVVSIMLYLITLILLTLLNEYLLSIKGDLNLIFKLFDLMIFNLNRLLMAVTGILCVYLIVNYFIEIKKIILSKQILQASSICYGIYVFHQFILEYLYYYSSLPKHLGSYLLPMGGFAITMLFSILFSKLTLKTKFGRFMIG